MKMKHADGDSRIAEDKRKPAKHIAVSRIAEDDMRKMSENDRQVYMKTI